MTPCRAAAWPSPKALSAAGREDEARGAAEKARALARASAGADPDAAEWADQAQRLIASER